MRYVVNKESTLSNIADAIRYKDGSEDPIAIVDIPEHIRNLNVGDCLWTVNHYKEGSLTPEDTDYGTCRSGVSFEFPTVIYDDYYSPIAYSNTLVARTINVVNYHYLYNDEIDPSNLITVTVNHYKQNADKSYSAFPSEVDCYIVESTNEWEAPVKTYGGYVTPDVEIIDLEDESEVDYYYTVSSGGGKDITVDITQAEVEGVNFSSRVIWGTKGFIYNDEKVKYIYEHFNKQNRDNIKLNIPVPSGSYYSNISFDVVGCYVLKRGEKWLNYRSQSWGMIYPSSSQRAITVIAIGGRQIYDTTGTSYGQESIYISDLGFLISSSDPTDPTIYVDDPILGSNFVYDGTLKHINISIPIAQTDYIDISGDLEATNAGTYTVTFSLKDPINTKWNSSGDAEDLQINWYIFKKEQNITLSSYSATLDEDNLSTTATIYENSVDSSAIISAVSEDTSIATATINNDILTVTATGTNGGSVKINVIVSETENYEEYSVSFTALVLIGTPVYGAVWDGSSSPQWTRTDFSTLFSNPSPSVSFGSGSSPFDNIMPWAGMVRVTDAEAGELVAIPKYYYKLTYADTSQNLGLKIQISSEQFPGSQVSPAHMDRGDGEGERDVVYVGRYHCGSDYTSTTGVTPKRNTEKFVFVGDIKKLTDPAGSTVFLWDYAMYWTIAMLYLVEFANWNSQAMIGYGCSNSGSIENTGLTDSIPYHTGTTGTSLTNYGHTQYRYIEDLWGNVRDWVNGIYCNANNIYANINPNGSYTTDVQIGTKSGTGGYITGYTISTAPNYTWALYPTKFSGSTTTYMCDSSSFYSGSGSTSIAVGGYYSKGLDSGLFYFLSTSSSTANNFIGARLMKLPVSND